MFHHELGPALLLCSLFQLIFDAPVRAYYGKVRLLFRRLGVCAENTAEDSGFFQLDLFTDYDALEKEQRIRLAELSIRRKYGPNAVFKGRDLLEGATTLERNRQIGGHRA